MPNVFSPKITADGLALAGAGIVTITDVAFGTGSFTPDGTETELVAEVARVSASGSNITDTQVRILAVWDSDVGLVNVNEVGFFAGTTLFAVWSSEDIDEIPIAVKTDGSPFAFFYDLGVGALPPGSVTVLADTGQSQMLAALAAHTNEQNAHQQYLRRDAIANCADGIWCGTAGGTANALTLSLPALPVTQIVPAYKAGLRFTFKAGAANTSTVTVNVGGLGVKNVTKDGGVPLAPTDIKADGIYEIVYDGTQFQISGSAGSSATAVERFEFTGAGPYTVEYTPGSVHVYRNGFQLSLADFVATDGAEIDVPSAVAGDEIVVIVFSSFAVADAYTKAEVDAKIQATIINPDGHCRLSISAGSLLLARHRGVTMPINGVLQPIPSGGVTLAVSGASANTTYYVYAYMSGSTMALERSVTGYAEDATTGVMVKSTDATKTLVGIARTSAAPNWQLCRSWFNDPGFVVRNYFTTERSSANADTYSEINSEIRCHFLSWDNEPVRLSAHGTIRIDSTNVEFRSSISVDGVVQDVYTMMDSYAAHANMPLSQSFTTDQLSEGYHYATIVGKSSANTYSGHYSGGFDDAERTTLEVAIPKN